MPEKLATQFQSENFSQSHWDCITDLAPRRVKTTMKNVLVRESL
jgi:hypothetical protein